MILNPNAALRELDGLAYLWPTTQTELQNIGRTEWTEGIQRPSSAAHPRRRSTPWTPKRPLAVGLNGSPSTGWSAFVRAVVDWVTHSMTFSSRHSTGSLVDWRDRAQTRRSVYHSTEVFRSLSLGRHSSLAVVLSEYRGSVTLALRNNADVESGVQQLA